MLNHKILDRKQYLERKRKKLSSLRGGDMICGEDGKNGTGIKEDQQQYILSIWRPSLVFLVYRQTYVFFSVVPEN